MTLRPLAALLPLFARGACAPPVAADDDDATGPALSGDDDDQRSSPVAMSLRAGVEQEAYAFALRLDESFALVPDEERHSGGDYLAFGRTEAEATAGPLRAAYQVTSMAPLPVDPLRL